MDVSYEMVICVELRQRLELDSIIIVLQCNIVAVVWWCFEKGSECHLELGCLHHVALDGDQVMFCFFTVFIAVGRTKTDDS